MPQPLSRVRTDAIIEHSDTELVKRGRLLTMAGHTITKCAKAEANLGFLLSLLMRGEPGAATEMYLALAGAEARRVALAAAAKSALDAEMYALFELMVREIKPARDRRNELAHHIWATCKELPDAVLLIDPADASRWHLSVLDVVRDPVKNPVIADYDRGRIMVYREQDMLESLNLNRRAMLLTATFNLNVMYQRGETYEHDPSKTPLWIELLEKRALQRKSSGSGGEAPPQQQK